MRKIRFIKSLNFLEVFSLGVSLLLGSGIFVIPILAAKASGTLSIISWFIGAIFSTLVGLCLSELAVKIPRTGGPYAYAHKVFGNEIGFLSGWIFWIAYWMTTAAETIALSFYINAFLPQLGESSIIIAIICFLFISLINFFGAKLSGEVEDVLTLFKLLTLVIFIVNGLFVLNPTNFTLHNLSFKSLSAIGSSTFLILFAYTGFEIVTVPEGEIRNVKKTIRRAIFLSIGVTSIIYILIAIAIVGMTSDYNYTSLADLANSILGSKIGTLIALSGLITLLGTINAAVFGCARISAMMAKDKVFPEVFNHMNKYAVPDYSLAIQTTLTLLAILVLRDFEFVARLSIMLTLVVYLVSCLAAFKITSPLFERKHVINTRLTPIIASLLCIIIMLQLGIVYWVAFSSILALGYIIYLIERHRKIKRTSFF